MILTSIFFLEGGFLTCAHCYVFIFIYHVFFVFTVFHDFCFDFLLLSLHSKPKTRGYLAAERQAPPPRRRRSLYKKCSAPLLVLCHSELPRRATPFQCSRALLQDPEKLPSLSVIKHRRRAKRA